MTLGILGLALAGCGRAAPTPRGPSLAAPPVSVAVGGEKELAALLERQRGKVVLVDFWATWCEPCVKLFPHSVELQTRLGDRGLQVISVSLNETEEEVTVLAFLWRMHAAFPNLISRYGTGTRSVEAFEIKGGVPCLKLYDREGRLRKTFGADGPPLPEKIVRAVEELLGAVGPP
jgi:thiol-disulfide isomerase/thioredoxin